MKMAFDLLMNWDLFENRKLILLRQTLAAVLTGVGGTLLVTLFLTTFLPILKVVHFIPWLIGFNSAMTGYCLVDKTRDALGHRQLMAAAAGLANALITAAAFISLSIYSLDTNLFGPREVIIFAAIGTACSAAGAWLAARYFKL